MPIRARSLPVRVGPARSDAMAAPCTAMPTISSTRPPSQSTMKPTGIWPRPGGEPEHGEREPEIGVAEPEFVLEHRNQRRQNQVIGVAQHMGDADQRDYPRRRGLIAASGVAIEVPVAVFEGAAPRHHTPPARPSAMRRRPAGKALRRSCPMARMTAIPIRRGCTPMKFSFFMMPVHHPQGEPDTCVRAGHRVDPSCRRARLRRVLHRRASFGWLGDHAGARDGARDGGREGASHPPRDLGDQPAVPPPVSTSPNGWPFSII